MGNSLRCCLACVLPCGALDLIRIVHSNGYIEELPGRVTAAQILENNPNHVLTKPCSQGVACRVRPESDLKRGSIYFLVPASTGSPPRERVKKKMASSVKRRRVVTAATGGSGRKAAWRPHLGSISEEW
ncbi:uncharacterized protein LOC127252030 [Andrographis paniculata]|uniref:uncharacterized protein LOC127252030 n=1 Tax=Andrographis paniculata TaxID=175694 RepID=UPI0021E7992C|nr:uncharacterized protein LOC127252030 [Andrographis paniculata]